MLPKVDLRKFLQALDKHEPLRAMLQVRQPHALRAISSFRKRVGDNCAYVRAAVDKIWYDELEMNREQFSRHVRSAGYDFEPSAGSSA